MSMIEYKNLNHNPILKA